MVEVAKPVMRLVSRLIVVGAPNRKAGDKPMMSRTAGDLGTVSTLKIDREGRGE